MSATSGSFRRIPPQCCLRRRRDTMSSWAVNVTDRPCGTDATITIRNLLNEEDNIINTLLYDGKCYSYRDYYSFKVFNSLQCDCGSVIERLFITQYTCMHDE